MIYDVFFGTNFFTSKFRHINKLTDKF